MSTSNALLKIRNRTVEIKWTTQYADHIMSNFINDNATHNLSFLQISKMVKTANIIKFKNNNYRAYGMFEGVKYLAIIQIVTSFAIIKTCYKYGWIDK
jgi:hypothetical protein